MHIDGDDDDDLNGVDVLDPENGQEDQQPDDQQGEGEDDPNVNDADEHEVYGFGDAIAPSDDEPEHIRDLRQRYRDERKRREELEAQLAPKPIDIGPEPTLDDDDVQWDQDAFKRKWSAWNQRKSEVGDQERVQRERQEAAQREYQAEVDALAEQGRAMRVPNYEAVRDRALAGLSEAQQAMLIQATEKKAPFLYALGSNPDKLAELAKITNPVKFVAAAARLETQMKQGKRPTTQPERRAPAGGVAMTAGNANAGLERLMADASKTGDFSKVAAFKAKQRSVN